MFVSTVTHDALHSALMKFCMNMYLGNRTKVHLDQRSRSGFFLVDEPKCKLLSSNVGQIVVDNAILHLSIA